MAKKAAKSKSAPKNNLILVMVASVAICAILVLAWMIVREFYVGSQVKSAYENSENIVINDVGASRDLVDYILAQKAGCGSVTGGKNTEYIVKQQGDIALTMYGCSLDARMFYKKVDGKWQSISPTNQFIGDIPLCSHLKAHGIPASFQSSCYADYVPGSQSLPELQENLVK